MTEMTPLEVANMIHIDINGKTTKALFSTFTSLASKFDMRRQDSWLQNKFITHNSTYVVTLLTDYTIKTPGMSCLLQLEYVRDWWSVENKSAQARFEELGDWLDNNVPDTGSYEGLGDQKVPASDSDSNARSFEITFPGDWQSDERVPKAFQEFVEKICNHLASL